MAATPETCGGGRSTGLLGEFNQGHRRRSPTTKKKAPLPVDGKTRGSQQKGSHMTSKEITVPTCSVCRRERGLTGMDAYDYSPMQVLTGQPLGWYSGDDGEVCPEDMTKMMRNQ